MGATYLDPYSRADEICGVEEFEFAHLNNKHELRRDVQAMAEDRTAQI